MQKKNIQNGLEHSIQEKQALLKKAMTEGYDITFLSSKDLNIYQMEQIYTSMKNGLKDDEIQVIADPKFDEFQMAQLRVGFEVGVDAFSYADCSLSWQEMHQKYVDLCEVKHSHNTVDNDVVLSYKGIIFDDWTFDEETNSLWGEMCQKCYEKYKDILTDELSMGGIGACSVDECTEVGYDNNFPAHFYVDFKPEFIQFMKRGELDKKTGLDSLISSAKNRQLHEPGQKENSFAGLLR